MNIAVITGASSGLGKEFVRQLEAKEREKIDEFWLIARRADRLEEVAAECDVPCRVMSLDLAKSSDIDQLEKTLEEEQPNVSFLVCSAGLGRLGKTDELSRQENDQMIDVNCRAAVDVTTVCLPYVSRGSRIIEICSTAGFMPMPRLNLYSASKAFLLNYTKCLAYEMLGSGVHVTAVCPYWIKDTEFIAGAETTGKGYGHYPLAQRAKTVVSLALIDSKINHWVSTPGIMCTLHRIFSWIVPDFLKVPFMDLFRHI